MDYNYRPWLNELLAELEEKDRPLPAATLKIVGDDCDAISPQKPFVHIKNFHNALDGLSQAPYWLAYGGSRTASTFSMYLMDLLLASLAKGYIRGWEGDFRDTSCFFDMVDSSSSLRAGLLKIHRHDELCNKYLCSGRAKALVTTRDFPSVAVSWVRMRANIHSPFYSGHTSEENIVDFVRDQINLQRLKMSLPGCLFLKMSDILDNPRHVVEHTCRHLGIKVSKLSLKKIVNSTSKEQLTRLQRGLRKNHSGHDYGTFLHFNHIDTMGFDDENIRNLVMAQFANELDSEGYLAV